MAGFVYILSNKAFSGLIKIGKSTKDPTTDRGKELYNSGVAEPFKCEYFAFVENENRLETNLHTAFASYRPNKQREFFNIPIPEVVAKIHQLTSKGNSLNFENFFISIRKNTQVETFILVN
jgi:hypothetical protein